MAGIYRRLLDRIAGRPDARVRPAAVAAGGRRPTSRPGRWPGGRAGDAASAVVGGGLAGITAALGLAAAGREVDAARVAGPGSAGWPRSFRRGELTVDNGQHVFLRCCTRYRGLLDRLGVTALTTLQPRLDIPVLTPGRAAGPAAPRPAAGAAAPGPRAARLPACCSPAERVRAARATLALRRGRPGRPGRRRA